MRSHACAADAVLMRNFKDNLNDILYILRRAAGRVLTHRCGNRFIFRLQGTDFVHEDGNDRVINSSLYTLIYVECR